MIGLGLFDCQAATAFASTCSYMVVFAAGFKISMRGCWRDPRTCWATGAFAAIDISSNAIPGFSSNHKQKNGLREKSTGFGTLAFWRSWMAMRVPNSSGFEHQSCAATAAGHGVGFMR